MPIDLIDQIISMGITVHLSLNNLERIVARHKDIEWICGQAALTVSLGYISGRDLFLKRLMDVTIGSIGCLITGLLTLVLGPMIYLASPALSSSTRPASARTAGSLKCTNSAACTWTRNSASRSWPRPRARKTS
jgi:hypothetical protein